MLPERWITDWAPSARWPHYTRANAGEVLPSSATPLCQTFSWDNGIMLGWRDGYVRIGLYAAGEMSDVRPEPAGFFGGYHYINLANVRMQGVRNPAVTVEQLDLAFFGDHPDVPVYEAHPDDEKPELTDGILAHMGWVMTATEFPDIEVSKAATTAFRAARPDLTKLSDEALLARARETQPMLIKLFEEHVVTSSSSGIAPGVLFAVGEAIGDPSVPMRLIASLGDVDSAAPSWALWDLSRAVRGSSELTEAFEAGVDGLLDRLTSSASPEATSFVADWNDFAFRYGSRGPNEYELANDTWETSPAISLAIVDRIRFQDDSESPTKRHARQAAERETTIAEVRAAVAALGNDELVGMLEGALVASNMMWMRERTKTNLVRIVHEGRMVFRELGRRMAERGAVADARHIFMVMDHELESFVGNPTAMKDELAARYGVWTELNELEPPFFIKNGVIPPITEWQRKGDARPALAVSGDTLHGVAGSPGVVRGKARVILDPTDPEGLEPGDIMVAPLTDPAWTPLFMSAGGVVVDVGGQISHAIIVSRELGLPCVVSVTDATKRIPDGADIEVDGNTGQVRIL